MPASNKLKIANVGYLNSAPYRRLSTLDFVDYSEWEPSICARQLHNFSAHLALIPVSECFMHGGYNALPYGIAARGPVESVMLYSAVPINDLKSILIDESSHTSVSLLRTLLPEIKFSSGRKPELIRTRRTQIAEQLAGDIGGLIIGDLDPALRARFPHTVDLSEFWYSLTGLPFVFAVWALRAESINSKTHLALLTAIEDSLAKKEIFAREWAETHNFDKSLAVDYVNNKIFYAIDDEAFEGLREFHTRGSKLGIFPPLNLSSFIIRNILPTFSNPAGNISDTKSQDELLQKASSSARLSVAETVHLINSASYSDLSLTASIKQSPNLKQTGSREIHTIYYTAPDEQFRNSRFRNTSVTATTSLSLLVKEEIEILLEPLKTRSNITILLLGELTPEISLSYFEELLTWISANYEFKIIGFSGQQLQELARRSNISLEAVLLKLQIAGLSEICDEFALGDKVNSEHCAETLKQKNSPFFVHQLAHRLGIRSSVRVKYSADINTYDQLLTLHFLRNLQDETNGITALQIDFATTLTANDDAYVSNYLKYHAGACIFLDNITVASGVTSDSKLPLTQLLLLNGAKDLRWLPSANRITNHSAEYISRSQQISELLIKEINS